MTLQDRLEKAVASLACIRADRKEAQEMFEDAKAALEESELGQSATRTHEILKGARKQELDQVTYVRELMLQMADLEPGYEHPALKIVQSTVVEVFGVDALGPDFLVDWCIDNLRLALTVDLQVIEKVAKALGGIDDVARVYRERAVRIQADLTEFLPFDEEPTQ